MARRSGERGFALVAAVASILVFSMLALNLIAATRLSIAAVQPEVERLRVLALFQAGQAMAISGLLADDESQRWAIDGRPRNLRFDGRSLSVTVEDERGKVPINLIEETEITAMLELVGVRGERLAIMRASLLDWRDQDDEPRRNGAEEDFYAPLGFQPRNGRMQTIGELAVVRGFDQAIVDRLAPLLTVHFDSGVFNVRTASPQAILIMYGELEGAALALARERELGGQREAIGFDRLGFAATNDYVGRPLSIVVRVPHADGGAAVQRCIIELTGNDDRPYVVRTCSA